jgi:hypothetical protein
MPTMIGLVSVLARTKFAKNKREFSFFVLVVRSLGRPFRFFVVCVPFHTSYLNEQCQHNRSCRSSWIGSRRSALRSSQYVLRVMLA